MDKKENVEIASNEEKKELTDDELYAQIQTEKLLKKKKVRKIATLSSLCVAFALAVCLIVLAVVPVSLKPKCAIDGFTTIQLYHVTQSVTDIDASFNKTEDKDKFNLFLEKYNQSFNTSYLSAIFNGSLMSYKIEEGAPSTKSDSNLSNEEYEDSYVPAVLSNNNSYFVRLGFDSNRKFVKQNGQVYKSRYGTSNSSSWDGSLEYKYIFVAINQSRSNHVTFYVLGKSPLKRQSDDTPTINYHLITVEVKADTNPIYVAWNNLISDEE